VKVDGFIVALRLAGRRCLVVGRDSEAAERAERLAEAGATVIVVGSEPAEATSSLAASGRVSLRERAFEEADLDECRLAVLTDRDETLAARMADLCRSRNVLFCAVDQPHGDFAHVAVVRRGPLSIAVSTDGRVPALARRLRQELFRLLDNPALDAFIAELEELRAKTPRADRARVLAAAAARLRLPSKIRISEAASDPKTAE
jgi:siroheme synthase-like protein